MAWWLVTLCAFFGFSVANFGTHIATMACLFAAFFVYNGTFDERQSERSQWRLFAVGLLLGYCALIRYLDWIPLMGWIAFNLLRRRKIKGLVLVLFGFALLASGHLFYNHALTGNAFLPPFVHDVNNRGTSLGISWTGFTVSAIRLKRVLYAFLPAILLLLCLIRPCRSVELKKYLTLFTLQVCLYFFYPWGVAGPGPRYYFPYFPFLILAVIEMYRLNRDQWIGRMGGVWPSLASLFAVSFMGPARPATSIDDGTSNAWSKPFRKRRGSFCSRLEHTRW